MNRDECLTIVENARAKDVAPDLRCADLRGADLRGADLRCADLRCADLRGADLRCADLRCANLDFASWPLHCGGTLATLDERLSLQLIYHAFNQMHKDAGVLEALEPLRPLAQKFINNYRTDATRLRPEPTVVICPQE